MRILRNFYQLPMVFCGDFSEIVSMSEKQGGAFRSESVIDGSRRVIDDCRLRDLGYRGSIFTWQRGMESRNIVRETCYISCQ